MNNKVIEETIGKKSEILSTTRDGNQILSEGGTFMKGSWQPSEIEIVNNVDLGIVGVQELLPDRRVKGIRVRAHQLLKVKKTQKKARNINMSIIERERYIISGIGTKTPTELAHELNVSRVVIYNTCKHYGVEIYPMWKPWEIEKTKNVYPSGEDEGVQALLPHVTANGRAALLCIKKAQQKANIVDMSIEERSKYILANIDTKTLDELAEELKVSVDVALDICTREVNIELYKRKKEGRKNNKNKAKRKASLTFC
jgi:hypothetical protein